LVLTGLLPAALVVGWVGALHLAAWGAGRPLFLRVTRGGTRADDAPTGAFLSILLGFAILAHAALALAAARLLYAPLLVAIAIALAAAGAARALRALRAPRAGASLALRLRREDIPLVIALLFAATFVPRALDPVLEHDDNVYHLLLPKLYLGSHALVQLPLNLFANMPHVVEVLDTFPMAIGDYTAPKLLTLSFALWTIVGIAAFVAPRAGRTAAGIAALMFVSGKNVQWHLGLGYVEPVIGAYLLGGMLALLAWSETRNAGYLAIVGVAVGVACAAKYSAWFPAAALAAASVAATVAAPGAAAAPAAAGAPSPARRPLRLLLPAAAIALAIVSPWLVKNALFTGNPIYPNAYRLLGGREWSDVQALHLARMERSADAGRAGIAGIAAIPFDLSVRDRAFECPSASIALFAFFLVALGRPSSWRGRDGVLPLAAALGFLAWALSVRQGRFLVAWIPVMTLSASLALVPLRARPRALAAIAALVLVAGVFQIATQKFEYNPKFHLLTRPRADFVGGNANYELCRFLNAAVPPEGKVLALWDNRFFFLERPFAGDSVYEAPSGLAWLRRCDEAAAFAREVASAGYTHVVIYTTPFHDYVNDGMRLRLTDDRVYTRARLDRDAALVDQFVEGFLEPIHREGNHLVFRLRRS